MILYKYAHKHGLDILKNLELKVSRLDQFNDPFEFLPATVKTFPTRTLKKAAKSKDFQRLMYEDAKAKGFRGSFKEFRTEFRKVRQERVRNASLNPKLPKQILVNLRDYFDRNGRVLSLSSIPDNILMWSHYGDFHRGTVLGIDTSQMPPEWTEKRLKVEYPPDRVKMSLNYLPGSPEHHAFINAMISTKSSAWVYESEYRLLLDVAITRSQILPDGSTGYFVKIPPAGIREVILGCRCTSETERDVRKALTADHFKHVTLKKAVIHDTEFKLDIVAA